jgi:asparagine synthase (glutamine-hydrolysing)
MTTPSSSYLSTHSFLLLQFSDGVGYGWIDSLRDHADKNVSDLMFQNASFRFPENTPVSKEAYYYRSIFEEHYPQVSHRDV